MSEEQWDDNPEARVERAMEIVRQRQREQAAIDDLVGAKTSPYDELGRQWVAVYRGNQLLWEGWSVLGVDGPPNGESPPEMPREFVNQWTTIAFL